MSISARLQVIPAANRRGWTRRSLSLVSNLQGSGQDVTIHDLSSTGLLIETPAELAVDDKLEIDLPEAGLTPAIVVWNSGNFYGCQFKEGISQAAISAALLRSPARPKEAETLPQPEFSEPISKDDFRPRSAPDEDKASLTVRLRVLLGSAVVLWAVIVVTVWSLYKLV